MPSGNSCPRCGNGALFKGFVALQPSCASCGLSYDFADTGDGPAVFVIMIASALMVGATLWVELTYEPPMWVTLSIFLPLTAIVCLGLLRPLKALTIHQQYRTRGFSSEMGTGSREEKAIVRKDNAEQGRVAK